jgi:hypothetical protein
MLAAAAGTIVLPIFASLRPDDQERIVDAVAGAVGRHGSSRLTPVATRPFAPSAG